MFQSDSVFVGIDPTSAQKSFTFAALDKDLNLLTLTEGEIQDVVAFLLGQSSAVVAVNSPSGINRGIVRQRIQREMPATHQIRGADMRLAEYQLRNSGIAVTGTPASIALCPAWMQLGFEVFRALENLGFRQYPATFSAFQVMETHPHACFCVLGGGLPLSKPSLEGRLQRQLILYDRGIGIRDPMEFFEEITRYKLAKGVWPIELLYLPEQLDALAAAFTAYQAIRQPEKVFTVGDAGEGIIVVPDSELKEMY